MWAGNRGEGGGAPSEGGEDMFVYGKVDVDASEEAGLGGGTRSATAVSTSTPRRLQVLRSLADATARVERALSDTMVREGKACEEDANGARLHAHARALVEWGRTALGFEAGLCDMSLLWGANEYFYRLRQRLSGVLSASAAATARHAQVSAAWFQT